MTSPILVTGAEGMLGVAVVSAAIRYGAEVIGLSKQDCDITDQRQVEEVLGAHPGSVVINCAGIVRERLAVSQTRMYAVNAVGPHILARYAGRLLQVSTDCVFDGTKEGGGYSESDTPNPPDAYAKTKLAGEVVDTPHLTIRASFVGLGRRGLLHWLLSHPQGAEVFGYKNWAWNGRTAAGLAPVLIRLALDPEITGLVHLPGPDAITKAWLLQQVVKRLRPDMKVILSDASESRYMVLVSNVLGQGHPGTTWTRMLEDLEEEYRTVSQKVARVS